LSVVGDVTRAYVSACAAGYELAQAQIRKQSARAD
jgi:hypothetical protein